jgi:hypothetical protein
MTRFTAYLLAACLIGLTWYHIAESGKMIAQNVKIIHRNVQLEYELSQQKSKTDKCIKTLTREEKYFNDVLKRIRR